MFPFFLVICRYCFDEGQCNIWVFRKLKGSCSCMLLLNPQPPSDSREKVAFRDLTEPKFTPTTLPTQLYVNIYPQRLLLRGHNWDVILRNTTTSAACDANQHRFSHKSALQEQEMNPAGLSAAHTRLYRVSSASAMQRVLCSFWAARNNTVCCSFCSTSLELHTQQQPRGSILTTKADFAR